MIQKWSNIDHFTYSYRLLVRVKIDRLVSITYHFPVGSEMCYTFLVVVMENVTGMISPIAYSETREWTTTAPSICG